jgi:hypothetical protein
VRIRTPSHMSERVAGEQSSQHDGPAQSPSEAQSVAHHGSKEQEQAAQLIQKNYRGYRERRQLEGMGLDANSRWSEVYALSFYCRHKTDRYRP